jgi:diguanylate cyclase (GGDEF)-like protein
MSAPPKSNAKAQVAAANAMTKLAPIAAWTMLVVASLVLLGWCLQIPALTRLMTIAPSMKAPTAIAFIASGLALLGCARVGRGGLACVLPNLLVLLIGSLSILEHTSGATLFIDQLFADPEALARGNPPGRMPQMTAIGLVLLAAQGLLVSQQRAPRLCHLLAGVLLSLGAFALTLAGYSYQMGVIQMLPVSPPTAILFLLATLGWLVLQQPMGIMRVAFADSPGTVLLKRAGIPALLMPPVLAIAIRAAEHLLNWTHTEVVAAVGYLSGVGACAMVVGMAWLLHHLDEQQQKARRFHDAAYTDALTGVTNRRGFDEAIEHLLQGHRGTDHGFTMLMLDLDHFKNFNDDFGHLAGDEALQITGQILLESLRPQDIAARFGGEEFAVILPGTEMAGGRRAAQRLLQAFRTHDWPYRKVTVSIGIANSHPDDTAATLIARADEALYAAKSGGRDRACEAAVGPPASGL